MFKTLFGCLALAVSSVLAAAVPQAFVSPQVLRLPAEEAAPLPFTRLSTFDGLSHTRAAHIIQGPQGYMWFGTQYGLNRFDGYKFKVFVHDPRRSSSLAGTFVTALFKDRDDIIWVACSQVLDRFDARTETFTHFRIDSDDKRSGDGTVVGISQDRAGFLWLSTGRGLHRMDPASGALLHFYHDEADPNSLSTNDIKWTGEDRNGQFWVGTALGLDKFDRSSGHVLFHIPLPDAVGIRFFEDKHGLFWITHSSGIGLAIFDPKTNMVTPVSFYAKDPVASALTGVMAVLEDRDGGLWFGSPGAGILKFDHERRRFERYRFRGGSQTTLADADDSVITLAQDAEGDIWAGLHSLGVNHFSRSPSPFRIYRHEANDSNSLDVDFVNAAYEGRDGVVWIGNDFGLNRIDASGRRTLLTFGLGAKPMVISVTGDAAGIIWAGTFSQGLVRFDPKSGNTRFFRHDPADSTSLSNDEVHKMLVDSAGVLWIATDDGLDRFDAKTGRFTVYKVDPQGRRSQSYLSIAEAPNGDMWLGTHYSGLHRLNSKTGQISVFRSRLGDIDGLRDDSVPAVLADASGLIWAGTLSGLNSFNPATGRFRAYDVSNGLPANFISCILQDSNGILWLSTSSGLSKFDAAREKFVNYSMADGLPGNDLTGWGSCSKGRDGRMYFAGYPGAVTFDPRDVSDEIYVPNVVLTDFQLFGRSAPIGAGSPLTTAIGYTRHVTLSHEQNVFAVEFSALSFRSPLTNRYRYKLEGLDRDWTEVGSGERRAVYTTLPAGSYTFLVQGANLRGPWGASSTALQIEIQPAWWQTWWFRAACVVAALVGLFLLYRWRLNQISRRLTLRMEERVSERTRIAQDLHDTVLQGMLSVSLQLAVANGNLPESEPTKPRYVSILAVLRQLVEESRNAVRGLRKLNAESNTLEKAIAKIPQDLAGYAQTDLRLTVEGATRSLRPLVQDEVYLMAREAFANAFRHSRASKIEAVIQYEDESLHVAIRDNGVGIDGAVLEAGRSGHYGLSGMRERAERMGAELTVSSAVNSGTEIGIFVPATKAYLDGASSRSGWLARFRLRKEVERRADE